MRYNIAILASGAGTNAENLMRYFKNHSSIQITLVITNNSKAGVIQKAESYHVPVITLTNAQIESADQLVEVLRSSKIDLIVLAGFLRKIPSKIIEAWPQRIINIHPSLLPKYGGQGMYGDKVHQAVIHAGEHTSGISIHLVSEEYDRGKILYQAMVAIDPGEHVESLAHKIHQLEYQHLPAVVEQYVLQTLI